MIQFLDVDEKNTVATRMVGEISRKDVDQAAREIDRLRAEEGKVNMYIELDNFQGYDSMEAFFEDFKESLKHFDDFNKIALISQDEWLKGVASITKNLLPQTDARYYRFEERPQALRWLKH